MLFIVSTPIGNMSDITLRAIETLKSSDAVVAEDTRSAGRLLKRLEIPKKPFISYNDHNSARKIPMVISMLREGKAVSLVSENGTPAISDPGFKLIRECIREGLDVVPIPGPSAFVAALVASGLPTDEFTFYGFLPKSEKKRKDMIQRVDEEGRTGIFYESPHRIIKTLSLLADILPKNQICLARELTKKFEEFLRGTPKEVLEAFMKKRPKGEMVLVIGKLR